MPFGILQPSEPNVAGTAILDDLHKQDHLGVDYNRLKKGTGRYKHIVLVPQPSDDPRDPLNWPRWKKEAAFWTVIYMSGLVGAIGPLLASGYVEIAQEWNDPVNTVAASNGYLLIGLGVAMFFFSAVGVKFGRRPSFIIGAILMFACSLWSGASKDIGSFTASRVMQGVGMAPYEAMALAYFADLYHVHERGFRITAWGFSIISGIAIAPVINGYVVAPTGLGWRWCFWLISIFLGLGLLGVIFFVPETIYDREAIYETDRGARAEDVAKVNAAVEILENAPTTPDEMEKSKDQDAVNALDQAHVSRDYLPAKTFVQELAPWSGYVHKAALWKILLRPIPLSVSPVVIGCFMAYAMPTAWIVVVSVVSSIIFGESLHFTSKGTGNMSIGTWIAAILGSLVTGPMIDYLSVWAARRNKSVFEPEFRLLLVLPGAIICIAGYAGWAGIVSKPVTTWVGIEFMYSFIYFGNGLGSAAIVAYTVDVHRETASEVFALINFAKDIVLYGFTQFVANWVLSETESKVFGILAACAAACYLFCIPLWVYGKHFRLWIQQHPKWFSEKDY